MVNELDVAGEFIYDGITTLNHMKTISVGAPLFSFLYHISVGVERLQKIVLVLLEDITLDNYEDFEKSLITHSHCYLHERISKQRSIDLNSRENDFLQLLTKFYKDSRYNRFRLDASLCQEKEITEIFIINNLDEKYVTHDIIFNDIIVNKKVKELFGKVVGGIASKYYNILRALSNEKNTYTFELRSGSKAEKIFLSNYRKNSLQEMKITETIALKELLVFISNTREKDKFICFFKQIEPLQLDIASINDYISGICDGVVPQELIDEVECLYEEQGYGKERIEQMQLIGNPNVIFGV